MVLAGLWGAGPAQAQGSSSGEGVLGWCTAVGPGQRECGYGSAIAACGRQKEVFNPAATLYGANPDPDNWRAAGCSWCDRNPSDGSCRGPLPATVGFNCADGYFEVPPGVCIKNGDPWKTAGSCSIGGGQQNPLGNNPTVLSTGAKRFGYTDYGSLNGALDLNRVYINVRSVGDVTRAPLGLGTGWLYDFQLELGITSSFSARGRVTIAKPDGNAINFARNDDGSFSARWDDMYDTVNNAGYTLSMTDPWPSDLGTVTTTKLHWKLIDPDSNVWTLESVNTSTGTPFYGIARPTSLVRPNGIRTSFTYGTFGELLTASDDFGRSIAFTWNYVSFGSTQQRPMSIKSATLPDGTSIAYTYAPTLVTNTGITFPDRLAKFERFSSGNTLIDAQSYGFADTRFPFFITDVTDIRNVQVNSVTYDARGRVTASVLAGGLNADTITYGEPQSSMVTRTLTNALGKSAIYNYKSSGFGAWRFTGVQGVASANCSASATAYTYDSNFYTASETDEEGRVTAYVRDGRGRPTSVTRGSGTAAATTTTMTWHTTLNVPTQIVEPGLTTDLTWNAAGQLTQVKQTDTTSQTVPFSTNGRTRIWAYTYGTGGLVASVDGPLSGTGDTQSYTYNANGFLQTATNEVGHVTTVTAWNGRGQPTSVTDPNGLVSTYAYDAMGRLTGIVVEPGSNEARWTMTYTAAGDIASLTEPTGNSYSLVWDNARRLTSVTDKDGAVLAYTRDAMGNATATTIKLADGTARYGMSQTFDELGRLISQFSATDRTWRFAYDRSSQLTGVTDPRSKSLAYGYDAVSRLVTQTERDGGVETRAYNGKDEEVSYKDPRNLTTAYVRNGFGEVIQETSPDRGKTVYDHDAAGRVIKITDARNVTTNQTWDAVGRLLTRTYPTTALNVALTYDGTANGNPGKGRLTRMQDGSGTADYTYNAKGRVTKEVRVIGSVSYTTQYSWDGPGHLWGITYPSGKLVIFDYNTKGRLNFVGLRRTANASLENVVNAVVYRPFGPMESINFGNSGYRWYDFDSDYRILGIHAGLDSNGTVLMERYLRLGDGTNLTRIDENTTITPANQVQAFTYDDAGRMLTASGVYGSLAWTYDKVGNRLSETRTPLGGSTTSQSYAYPSTSNRASGVTQGSTTVRAFGYDAAGNLTGDTRGSTAYVYRYNSANRLDQLTVGGTVKASYSYDGRGRLAVRQLLNSTPSGTTHVIHDAFDRVIAEADATGAVQREYLWLGDVPVAVLDGSATPSNPTLLWVQADHQNRPWALLDASGAVKWRALYEPFGTVASLTGPAALNLRFPGQWFQLEAGLAYNWHRHYDATLGRYTQPDPLGLDHLVAGPGANEPESQTGVLADLQAWARSGMLPFAAPSQTSLQTNRPTGTPTLASLRDGPSLYGYVKQTPLMEIDPQALGTPRKGPAWGFSIFGNTCRFYDGNGDADFDIDIPGHHYKPGEWHGWYNGRRGPAVPF